MEEVSASDLLTMMADRGITLADIARLLDVNVRTVRRWACEETSPSQEMLYRLYVLANMDKVKPPQPAPLHISG